MEEWRDIPGLPLYQASTLGRIRSLPRTVCRIMPGGREVLQPLKGKVLSPHQGKNGYLYVAIYGVSYTVHRLVARTWVPGYAPGLDAAHGNNKRHDNVITNLVWKTRLDNIADQLIHGTRLRGETQNGAKLTTSQVLEMRKIRKTGLSWSKIADMYGVARATAKDAILGRTWSHV